MENRKPATVSIEKIVDCLKGEILSCPEQSVELVEHLMVGAMCVDPAPSYFKIKSNKAVITRGDRADIQLGALETSTKCLILTGGIKPTPSVMQLANENNVPVILVAKDTPATLADLEECLGELAPEISTPEPESESPETVAE